MNNSELRDHFAGLAMQAIMQTLNQYAQSDKGAISVLAYAQADAMIMEKTLREETRKEMIQMEKNVLKGGASISSGVSGGKNMTNE